MCCDFKIITENKPKRSQSPIPSITVYYSSGLSELLGCAELKKHAQNNTYERCSPTINYYCHFFFFLNSSALDAVIRMTAYGWTHSPCLQLSSHKIKLQSQLTQRITAVRMYPAVKKRDCIIKQRHSHAPFMFPQQITVELSTQVFIFYCPRGIGPNL